MAAPSLIQITSNTKAAFTTVNEMVRDDVDDALSWRIPNAFRSPAFKAHLWDGKKHLLSQTNSFPRGLVPLVQQTLEEKGAKYDLMDIRPEKPPKFRWRTSTLIPKKLLRATDKDREFVQIDGEKWVKFAPHQVRAIYTCLKTGNGVVFSGTGTGKTEIAMAVALMYRRWLGNRTHVLFFTHRKKLARDTRRRFAVRLGMQEDEIGFIAEGAWHQGTSGIYIAILDTLKQAKWEKKRKLLFRQVKVLIIDECHHASADTWYKTIQKCHAPFRFGLSGTPVHRRDGRNLMLIGATGPVIFKFDLAEAIKAGVVTPVDIRLMFVNKATQNIRALTDWTEIYAEGIVNNFEFHKMVAHSAEEDLANGKTIIILLKELRHAENLIGVLDSAGIDAAFVHGGLKSKEQDDIIGKFSNGHIKLLIGTTFLGEGVDIPRADTIYLCDSERSIISVIQKIGRGVRKMQGKSSCLVRDFVHGTNKKLAEHSLNRVSTYEDWGLEAK